MQKQSNKNVFALILIVTGILLVLKTFNFPFLGNFNLGWVISLLWPLFILVPGLNMLRHRVGFGGLFLTLIGASFLLDNFLHIFGFDFKSTSVFKFFWPLLLIFIGYKILYSDKKTKVNFNFGRDDEDDFGYESEDEYVDDDYTKARHNTSSTTEKRRYDGPAKQTTVKSITFNSKKFHYTRENMPKGISRLNLNITFGGAEVIVEEGIQVILPPLSPAKHARGCPHSWDARTRRNLDTED